MQQELDLICKSNILMKCLSSKKKRNPDFKNWSNILSSLLKLSHHSSHVSALCQPIALHNQIPNFHQATGMCQQCLRCWFPELDALYSTSKEWQGVKQEELYLSLSLYFSQLDQFYYLQKTLRLEGSCQHCSSTAHLDRLLKSCLLAGEKRHSQNDLVLTRNTSNPLHGSMQHLQRFPTRKKPNHSKP